MPLGGIGTLRRPKLLGAALALTLAAAAAAAVSPAVGAPAVSESSDRFADMDAAFAKDVADGRMAGIVVLVAQHGKVIHSAAIGYADIEQRRKMSPDTVFRFYSMTKPITAAVLMTLYDEGRFRLDDPVAKYLPEFAHMRVLRSANAAADDTEPAARDITIEDISRHTAGLGIGLFQNTCNRLLIEAGIYRPGVTLAGEAAKVASQPLCRQPGTAWVYSLSPDIQARLVEVISGQSFDSFLQSRLLGPLGMTDTTFAPGPQAVARLARVYTRRDGKLSAWTSDGVPPGTPFAQYPFAVLNDPSVVYVRGSFGLYGTAGDYLRFAQMLADGGRINGRRLLSRKAVDLMMTDHLRGIPMPYPVKGLGFGLGGAVVLDPTKTGFPATEGAYSWDGAASTAFWVDRKNDLVVVALTQHLGVPGLSTDELDARLHRFVYPAVAP